MEITNTTAIRFGKRWYHKHEEMMQWCIDNIGTGGWLNDPEVDQVWMIECNFGNTKFLFVKSEDALAFKLHYWEICS